MLHIPACLAIPARMRRAEPWQVLFQLRSLSGKFNTALVDDILFQLCQQRFIPCPIRLVIGAFACELLIGIISHITERLKAAVPVGDDLRKRIRVCQRGQIDVPSLGNEPGAEVDKAVIAAAIFLHDPGGVPQSKLVRKVLIGVEDIMEILRLLRSHRYQPVFQEAHHSVHVLSAGLLCTLNQLPESIFVDFSDVIVHVPPLSLLFPLFSGDVPTPCAPAHPRRSLHETRGIPAWWCLPCREWPVRRWFRGRSPM